MKLRTILPLIFIAVLMLTACIPATTVPIGTTSFHRSDKEERRTLVVFLPGRGDSVKSYENEGFVQMLSSGKGAVDALGVEAHLGYYRDRSLLKRLREDVLLPAKKEGYSDIWLVGISLGGLGAILYDSTYPADLAGVIVMAPYLGEGTLLAEISRAGGLTAWRPAVVVDGYQEQEIWLKLKEYAGGSMMGAGRVFLGFGESDRFAPTNRYFAANLASGQTVIVPGGHDWPTWQDLWPRLLKISPLARVQGENR